ncbi:MAG: AAA-like domain-containing protein [Cyanosarcina radialis HA8281-LM2]|jgi:WD40 repeat protein|nr:AAA-like domain-containing protein [Cyanosarcina radialis HA8281-LM2]
MTYEYQVGGSLSPDAPSYAIRQADADLYAGLKAGDFCYIFNCRQMGKSSLQVRTLNRLKSEGIACSTIDFSVIKQPNIQPEQWYAGIVYTLVEDLGLGDPFEFLQGWWTEHSFLSLAQRLAETIDRVMLTQVSSQIVIFIDEIDSALSLSFPVDDFFALIRSCYNKRAIDPNYQRLTFTLIGVATPSDLIQDKRRTPFNIGRAIELTGFAENEITPLTKGLAGKADNPYSVLQAVIYWTGGQPYLTQKLCDLLASSEADIALGLEAERVENLVRSQIVPHWQSEVHFRTIRDRLLSHQQRAVQLLRLYQQVLHGEIDADDSEEQVELCLSGLAVKQQGKLKVYNRIYEAIFDSNWVEKALADLCPYAEAIAIWLASERQDESRLLRGQALQEALQWAEGRNLNAVDRDFLLASQQDAIALQQEEKTILQTALVKGQKALRQARRTAARLISFGSVILLVAALLGGLIFYNSEQKLTFAEQKLTFAEQKLTVNKIEQKGIYALQQFEFQPIKAVVSAIESGKELQSLDSQSSSSKLWDYPAGSPILALQRIGDYFYIKNEIDTHQKGVNSVNFIEGYCQVVDRNCKLITAGEDGTIRLWSALSENEIAQLEAHKVGVNSARLSKNEKKLVTGSEDGIVRLWSLKNLDSLAAAQKSSEIKAHSEAVQNVRFSPDNTLIATSGKTDGMLKLWSLNGQLQWEREAHKGGIKSLDFHPQGDRLVTGGEDGTAKLWSLDGDLLRVFEHHAFPDRVGVKSTNFNRNGEKLATAGDDGIVKIWDINGNLIRTITTHIGKVETVKFNWGNEQQIATSSSDDPTSTNSTVVRLWNWKDRELLVEFKGHQGSIESIRYSDDGRTLATAGKEDGIVRIWNLDEVSPARSKFSVSHKGKINSVRLNSNASTYVTAGDDGTIRLWTIDGKLLATFDKYRGKVQFKSNRFHPKDDSLMAVGDNRGQIRLLKFDGQNLKESIVFAEKHENGIESLNFSPDGQIIATASRDKTVKIWNLQGKLKKTISYNTRVWSLRFSPDSSRFVVGGEHSEAYLYDLNTGKQISLKTDRSASRSIVYAVGFTPDNQYIFTVDDDSTLYKWDLAGNRVGEPLKSYQGSVRNIGVVDELLATAGSGGTVYLWNFQGQQIADFKGHRGTVRSLGFSRDGKKLVSAGDDGVARVWKIRDLDELLQQGCDRLQEYLKNHQDSLDPEEKKVCAT